VDRHGKFVVQRFQAVEDVPVAALALRGNPPAENFSAVGVENDTFDFRSAEVNADAMHANQQEARISGGL
jgi:hypothetical protein